MNDVACRPFHTIYEVQVRPLKVDILPMARTWQQSQFKKMLAITNCQHDIMEIDPPARATVTNNLA